MKRLLRNTLFVLGFGSSGAWAACTTAQTNAQVCLNPQISMTMNVRFGLHLHRSRWDLDLSGNLNTGGVATASPRCYRAGFHAPDTGRDQLYNNFLNIFNTTVARGDSGPNDIQNPYDRTPVLTWPTLNTDPNAPGAGPGPESGPRLDRYPGLVVGVGSPAPLTWKGPMMCVFQTIVEKFSNNPGGYRLSARLVGVTHTRPGGAPGTISSFPDLVMREYDPTNNSGQVLDPAFILNNLGGNNGPKSLSSSTTGASFSDATGGWLDGNLLLALVFNGREQAGSYTATVQYNLFSP